MKLPFGPRGSWSALMLLLASAVLCSAQDQGAKGFNFTTFTVSGATTLGVESINNAGTISGYYVDSANNTLGFLRSSSGIVTPYTDPLDTTTPSYTAGAQINRAGAVAGEFFDTSQGAYLGYIYKSATGKFVTYSVPGQPQYTTNALTGINNKGEVCGYFTPPPYTLISAFVEAGGTVTPFTVNGSALNYCEALNDSGTAVGDYKDAAGVYHGWMRTAAGILSTIDVPAASTTPGTAPCVSGPIAGTVPLGINTAGYVSGHYWDTRYNEHGFLMTPGGKFLTIDVPGAYQTAGGGLNDKAVVVGHYADSTCASLGYIATP